MNNVFGATAVPFWLLFVSCACALFIGHGLRRWHLRRKRREEEERKERMKEQKREYKHRQRQLKKQKNKRAQTAAKPHDADPKG